MECGKVFFPTRSRLPPSFYFVEVSYPNIACDFKHVKKTLFLYSPENSLNNPNKGTWQHMQMIHYLIENL